MKRKPAGRIAGKSPIAGVQPPRPRAKSRATGARTLLMTARARVRGSFIPFAAPQMDHRRTAFPGPYCDHLDARSA